MTNATKETLGLSEENAALIERVTGLTSRQGFLLGLKEMNALLNAARANPLSEGEWVLVPREPTFEMIKAYHDTPGLHTGRRAWTAMLAASPSRPLLEENEGLIASGVLARGAVDHDGIEGERGTVTWFSSGEDEGPDCGLSVGLGGGQSLYMGELASVTVEACGVDPKAHDASWWLAIEGDRETSVFAAVADMDEARRAFDTIAAALASPAPAPQRTAPPADGIQGERS